MPVKFYVSKDYQQQENPPEYSHEIKVVIDIIKRIYAAYNHQKKLYVIIANLDKKDAHADLVIITEHGLGVIELKSHDGIIEQRGLEWYSDNSLISSGAGHISNSESDRKVRNPHEQVQAYAKTIRNILVKNLTWLPGTVNDRQGLKLSTSVCFSNDKAKFDNFRQRYYERLEKEKNLLERWEKFEILKPIDVTKWAAALRFDTQNPQTRESFRLTPLQIGQILKDLLGVIEWTEIKNLMPTGEPYAYLRQGNLILPLVADEVTIGRDIKNCTIVIPKEFKRVSHIHAKITRRIEGIFIEDLKSKNRTYINPQIDQLHEIDQAVELRDGDLILLGGQSEKPSTCSLKFSFEPPTTLSITEDRSIEGRS